MAEIEWKGAFWKAAYGDLSVRDLLTTLKGFGPMEILEFNKPGACRGQISLCLSEEDLKEVTIHDLEVFPDKRKGRGREILQWLKRTFKGKVYAEYPEEASKEESLQGSLPFWVKMLREGLLDGLECGMFCLYPEMGEDNLQRYEDQIGKLLSAEREMSVSDASQR